MDAVGGQQPLVADADLERTGDATVDEILDRLERLGPEVTPAEQAAVLEEVHDQLERRLSSADS